MERAGASRGSAQITPPYWRRPAKKKKLYVYAEERVSVFCPRGPWFFFWLRSFFFSLKAVVGGPGATREESKIRAGATTREGAEMDALPQIHLTALRSVASALFATTWRVSSDKTPLPGGGADI